MKLLQALGAVSLALLSCCGSSGGPVADEAFQLLGDTKRFGVIWSFAFDLSGAPLIGTQAGVHRWNGNDWESLPKPPIEEVAELVVGKTGVLYVRTKGEQIDRLDVGASSWTILADGREKFSRIVESSDGTLYALQDLGPLSSTMRVHFRKPADSAWIDSNVDVSVFCYPLADHEANIWCESSSTLDAQRIRERESQSFPQKFGFRPEAGHVVKTLAITPDGTHWAGSHNYVTTFGETWTWKDGSPKKQNSGASCTDGDDSTHCAQRAGIGGYVTSPYFFAPRTFFEMWAPQNGDTPYLMRSEGGGEWRVLASMGKPFFGGVATAHNVNPAAMAVSVGKDGTIYLYGSNLSPGSLLGTSVVMTLSL